MSDRPVLPRVLATAALPQTVESLLAGRVEIVSWGAASGAVDGIYCYGHRPVDAEVMDSVPGIRIISNHGVGVDHIDLAAAEKRGIPVGNTPGVLNGAVADMAFALLLAAARHVVEGDRLVRRGGESDIAKLERRGRDVHGSTLGIVGLGNIGAQVARRASGFNMRVLYHSRRSREAVAREFGAERVSLDELLSQSDFVVLIVPLTPETRHMIGRRQLALMKPTATLINVARGGIIDTDALTQTMQARRIFAAALDVTEPEPLPRDHPLLSLDNVTITPHLGSATVQTRQQMAELSVENLLAGLEGRPLTCRVA